MISSVLIFVVRILEASNFSSVHRCSKSLTLQMKKIVVTIRNVSPKTFEGLSIQDSSFLFESQNLFQVTASLKGRF